MELTMSETAEKRRFIVVTADAVEDTGRISYKFMIDADVYSRCTDVPGDWGRVWEPQDRQDREKEVVLINVFGSGGLVMGGPLREKPSPNPFGDTRSPEELKAAGDRFLGEFWNSIPSAVLLMTTDTFEWFREAAPTHGVEFEHIHHEGFLKTS